MSFAWPNIAAVLGIFTLAIISPGPNFILVVNTALAHGRRSGVQTALGVAAGSGLFALAGLLGLILLINSLPHFAFLVHLLGGGYLVWLGATMVWRLRRPLLPAGTSAGPSSGGIRPVRAFATGLLTNLTNPKAWAFYFSLFSLVITPGISLGEKGFLNLAMFLISFGWYAAVALLIAEPRLRPGLARSQPLIQGVLGVLLAALGSRLILCK